MCVFSWFYRQDHVGSVVIFEDRFIQFDHERCRFIIQQYVDDHATVLQHQHCNRGDHDEECAVVLPADAGVQIQAVMIKLVDTFMAQVAVFGIWGHGAVAVFAYTVVNAFAEGRLSLLVDVLVDWIYQRYAKESRESNYQRRAVDPGDCFIRETVVFEISWAMT